MKILFTKSGTSGILDLLDDAILRSLDVPKTQIYEPCSSWKFILQDWIKIIMHNVRCGYFQQLSKLPPAPNVCFWVMEFMRSTRVRFRIRISRWPMPWWQHLEVGASQGPQSRSRTRFVATCCPCSEMKGTLLLIISSIQFSIRFTAVEFSFEIRKFGNSQNWIDSCWKLLTQPYIGRKKNSSSLFLRFFIKY